METEKLKFKLELWATYWDKKPIVNISINDYIHYNQEIAGTEKEPTVVEFEHELTEGEKYTNRLVNFKISDLKSLLNLDNPNNPNYKKPEVEIESDVENYYLREYIERGHNFTDEQFEYFLKVSKN